VQRSGFPNAYAEWESLAKSILGGGTGIGPEGLEMELEEEPADGMVPSTPGGGFLMDPVHLPGAPTNRPDDMRKLLYGTEGEESSRFTNQPGLKELLYG
jgi:hypothetical protein